MLVFLTFEYAICNIYVVLLIFCKPELAKYIHLAIYSLKEL